MKKGISVCMIVYNDGEIIKTALESVKEIADEILIVHDGPDKSNMKKICRKYTKNFFILLHKGLCERHQAYLYRKAKFDWILKIDADEFLSKNLQRDIRKLIENESADAYSFIWPYWNGKRYITKAGPRKIELYRKDKISYIGFANFGEPVIKGNTVKTNYVLEHHPQRGDPTNWSTFKERDLKSVTFSQAQDLIKDFSEFDTFQYPEKKLPTRLEIRKKYPLSSAFLIGIFNTVNQFFNEGFLKDYRVFLKTIHYPFLRSILYGYYIFKLKKNPNWKIKDDLFLRYL